MPMICISGRWLENSGFRIGDEVSVKVTKNGELLISPLPIKSDVKDWIM
jgi:antitoxin component of MazEF toxin-antitoxin module